VSNLLLCYPNLQPNFFKSPESTRIHRLKKQDKGTYLLVIEVRENQKISVGKHSAKNFSKGIYLYVGRAKGGLQRRIERHLSKKKKNFWHIDYLLQKAEVQEVWIRRDFFDECQTALEVRSLLKYSLIPLKKFGASDCNCPSHLFYLPESKGSLKSLREKISFEKVEIYGNQA